MPDSALEARLHALETRLSAVEDQLAITRLMATYGPAVDGLDADLTSALWAEGGWYDAGVAVFEGRQGLRDLIDSELHQRLVAEGSAHLISAPQITVDGDTAIAVCYAQVLLHDPSAGAGGGWHVWRVTANRWEWVRTAHGWRVAARINRPLDGADEPRQLLRASLSDDLGRFFRS